MQFAILPITDDPRQISTLDVSIDGVSFHAQVEIRYLSAPDLWVISIWDKSSGELLVNQIPLICSYGMLNDLLLPFRHLRGGQGMGTGNILADKPHPASLQDHLLLSRDHTVAVVSPPLLAGRSLN